ncbi:hypothetical protein BDD12DRAFT_895547 [Trichophaea hybrida]|nr:hypothetical protein BDD12DRAFT_895547 [Trichophaea hybrida]
MRTDTASQASKNSLESIFNPETTLQYLNKGLNKGRFDIADPPHSEINDGLNAGSSANCGMINCPEFSKQLIQQGRIMNRTHLKIPNNVAAARIAQAICDRYRLKQDNVLHALKALVSNDGKIRPILGTYGTIMAQTATHAKHFMVDEAFHRDRMCGVLLQNHGIKTNWSIVDSGFCPKGLRVSRWPAKLLESTGEWSESRCRLIYGKTIKDWIDKEVRYQLYAYVLSPEMNSEAPGWISEDRGWTAKGIEVAGGFAKLE